MHGEDTREENGFFTLTLLGVAFSVVYSGITWVSFHFVYGQDHSQRPILPFLLLYFIAFCLYCASWRHLTRLTQSRKEVWGILIFAVIFRAIVLLSNPIQEDDFYRYLWDGKVVASGLNPYVVSPDEVKNTEDDVPRLQPYRHIPQQDPRFQQILARVNHPKVSTIYPPLAQGLFALTALVAPGSLLTLRIALFIIDIGLCGLIILLLGQLGCNRAYVLIYAWSPLVIKETINSAHYDVLPTFWLVATVALSLAGRSLLAHASLALAILGKVYPVLILPLLFWRTGQTVGWNASLSGVLVTLTCVGIGYAPFWQAGDALWQGTRTFAEHWQTNSFLFPFLHQMIGQRWLANGIVVCLLGSWMFRVLYRCSLREGGEFLWAVLLMLFALFLLSPVGNPWYFLWLMPFLCVFPLRAGLLLSGLLGLYYLYFYFLYQRAVETFQWVLWLEYLLFYGVLLWGWGKGKWIRDNG
ncbi:MAG: hypothetical protein AB7G75_27525 [Candidatus Binatia bacterium]